MKIIIPMASKDKDILENYNVIKPLVKLGNTTMIETFVENFKFDFEYIFLCRQQDLIETNLLNIIQNLKIKFRIVEIKKDTSSVIETIGFAKKYVKINEQILICHSDNINIFFSKNDLLKKLYKPNLSNLLFAYEEDSQTNTSYIKRFSVTGVTRDKEYNLTRGTENSKTLYFSANFYR